MKPDLSSRLNRLKQAQSLRKQTPTAEDFSLNTDEGKKPDLPEGWLSADAHVWKRVIAEPDPLAGACCSGYLTPRGIPPEKWLFFDTETTGLSGGAGNTAFLIGLGRVKNGSFLTTQYFLQDYPGESVMLSLLREEFQNTELFVSYNGKTYDSHLLQTRFLMNRMPFQFGPQLDLLYPVRQLYRRTLPDCRLGTTETFLLNKPRVGDIPGAEIPDIWFRFQKDRNHQSLEKVFEHNYLDIIRMAELLVFLESFIAGKVKNHPYGDQFALGRFLLDRGDPEGICIMEKAMKRGDPRAEAYLSVYWKRNNQWDKAVSLWEAVLRKRPGFFAGVEMAKYLEHREKDYSRALELVERLLRELPVRNPVKRAELQHRRTRLIAKISKGSENDLYE